MKSIITKHSSIAFTLGLLGCIHATSAAIIVRNSTSPAGNAASNAQWITDCGRSPDFIITFESGFTNGQNISGVPGLFPGGIVFRDSSTAGSAVVSTSAFGGSLPDGSFGLSHNETPYLKIEFPLPGVDGFALLDIDHTGTNVIVTHADGTTSNFTLDTTGSGGRIGEFVGVFRNDRPPIIRVDMDASGDGQWGIDNIAVVGNQTCDSIDFNNDTSFFDPQDIDAFLSVYSEGPCIPSSATCNDIDFNNDGSLFDPCDIDAFLLVFSEGPCSLCGV